MRTSIVDLQLMQERGEKIAMLTCYDSSFARVLEQAGVDALLIGDSLGMVVQGHDSPLPVSIADIAYHTRCVARGAPKAFLLADMPFATAQISPEDTFRNAAELMRAGAQMVKIEGGGQHGSNGLLSGDSGHSRLCPHRIDSPVRASTGGVQGSRP